MANSYRIGKNKFTQDKLNTMSGTDANAIYYATHQGNKSANTASKNTGAYVDTGKRGDISALKEEKKDDLNDIIKNVDKIRKSMSEVPSLKKPKQEEPKQQFSNTDKYAVKSALRDNKYTANKMAVKNEIARQNVMNSDLGANQQNPKYDDRGFQTKYGRLDEIDKFLNPDYKLTKEDKKRAQKIIEDYEYNHAMDANPNATELVFDEEHPDGYMKPIAEMSSEDKAEQEKIYALRDKISKGESALMGAMRTTPGVAALTRKGDEDGYWQNATANAQKQNPLAYTGGMLGNGILMNAVAQGALGATKYGEAVENLLGVGNGASAGSNVARKIAADALTDAPVDLVTDTIPELLYDIADDKSGKDIAKNLLANIALNTGMNVGASVLGNLDDIRLLQKSGESIPNTRGEDYVPDGSLQERIVGNVSSPTNNVNPNSKVVNPSNAITANSDMDIPHQIAARYAQAFSDFDTYGYMDDIQEMDGFVEKMADDIANGRDLSEYRRVLEDALEEAPDAETAEKMQTLISDIDNLSNQKTKVMAESASPKRDKRRYYETRNMINNKRLDNGILFDNEADKKAYIEARKKFAEANDAYDKLLDTATTTDEIVQAQGNIEAAYKDMRAAASKGFENDKTNQKALREVKKNFAERVKGTVINVPDSMRNEQFFLNKTLKQINDQYTTLGNNVIKFSKNSGTPIDSIWNELVEASGNALPADTINPVQMIEQLNDYVMSLKVDGKGIERVPADIARYVPEEYWNRIYGLGSDAGRRIDSIAESAITTTPIADEAFDSIESAPLNEGGMSRHMRGEGKMQMEGVSDEVKNDFIDDPQLHERLSNADTKARAEDIYNNSENPEAEFRAMLMKHDPAALPLGHQLAKDYSAQGNHEMAAQLYRDMGEQLTKAGQFSQAAIINMVKDDPLTALQYAEKEIQSINREGLDKFGKKWKDFALTDDEIDAFNNIKPGDEDAIAELFDEIGQRIGKDYPTTMLDKLLEGRRVAMLFNVRTNVRNLGANIPTLGMRWVADRVESVGQNIAHLINPDFKVTQSVAGSGINGRRLANEVFNSDLVQGLMKGQDSKYAPDVKSSMLRSKQMYKGTPVSKWINRMTNGGIEKLNEKFFGKKGVESGLETIRNTTYKLLELGDNPFVKENFVQRLGSYINAQGIKNVEDVPDDAIQTAWEEAMKATYKDNSWAVKMLRGIRGGIEKVPYIGKPLGQAAIPFLQAPGNIAARMVDYSPIKGVKGIADIVSGAKANDLDAVRKGIEEFSKGVTGSGMILLGMKLKESGLISGDYSDDKDQKNFQKMQGFRPYALHIGDKYFTYDWAQPFAEPMIIGTLLQEAIENSDKYDSEIMKSLGYEGTMLGKAMGVASAGTKAAINSWFNESPLQGIADLLKGDYSGKADVGQNLQDTLISDFAGSFIPAEANAIAKTIDPTQRNTYDPSNSFNTFVNQQIAKLPGLSKTLPAKYDTWGEPINYADSTVEAAAQRHVIPGDYGKVSDDPIDNEINRLFEETDNKVFPMTAPNSVNNRKLNNREQSIYQQDMGTRSRALVEEFINSDYYKTLDDKSRHDIIDNLYGASKAITERDKFDKQLSDNSSYKKALSLYDEAGGGDAGNKALIEYYEGNAHKNEVKDQLGTSAEWAQEIYDSGSQALIDKFKQGNEIAQSAGLDGLNENQWKIYNKRGETALRSELKYARMANDAGVSDSDLFRQSVNNGISPEAYKKEDDLIKSIQIGTDEFGDPKYMTHNETTADIYRHDGLAGLNDYAVIQKKGYGKTTYDAYKHAKSVKNGMSIATYLGNVADIERYNPENKAADGQVSQKELLGLFNARGFNQNQANDYWNTYLTEYKQIPSIATKGENKGKWTTKKAK